MAEPPNVTDNISTVDTCLGRFLVCYGGILPRLLSDFLFGQLAGKETLGYLNLLVVYYDKRGILWVSGWSST
jgi:hypothetical protein